MTKSRLRVFGIIGYPIDHTLSPSLHNAAFEKTGINAIYVPFAVHPNRLREAVEGIRAMDIQGVNVTVPHKLEVMRHLDRLDKSAERLGAVNTIACEKEVLTGYNTDGIGFIRSIEHERTVLIGKRIAVVGGGGAARAIVGALADAGVASIAVLNRTYEKAKCIARTFSITGLPVEPYHINGDIDAVLKNCNICINCTSLGLHDGDALPIPMQWVAARHILIDIIYNPAETPFLKAGKEKGAKTINGYGMLVYQAAEAFRIWTGIEPPIEVMWAAGLLELQNMR